MYGAVTGDGSVDRDIHLFGIRDVTQPNSLASPPRSQISRASCCAAPPSMSRIATLAPSLANRRAVAAPMPDAAPVRIAHLRASRLCMFDSTIIRFDRLRLFIYSTNSMSYNGDVLVRNSKGDYSFVRGIAPYSSGVVTAPGHEIVHVRFVQPVPLAQGLHVPYESTLLAPVDQFLQSVVLNCARRALSHSTASLRI